MNSHEDKYTRYALCREMMETPTLIRNFDPRGVELLERLTRGERPILLTGEGSSRIFPAKRARAEALRKAGAAVPITEGATQAGEYDLKDFAVLGASNSGRTRELVRLLRNLKERGHGALGGVTAYSGTPLEEAADQTLVLGCGPEDAVAATKSVVEQAMVWQALMGAVDGRPFPDLEAGAQAVEAALQTVVPEGFFRVMAEARTIYFAGRNDGVAEELTLKTNEIVRKTSDFLEGTYATHGIEEIMQSSDVLVLMNPFAEEEVRIKERLADGVGLNVIAIADRECLFPTLKIPESGPWTEYALLAAGWNLLVEAGIAAGVNPDKPERARKVGNEVD